MKTIIVTGSNSGIGKEAALILAADGHRVLMLSRDSEKSRRAADEIRAATGNDNVHLFPVDLAEQPSICAVVDRLRAEFNAIDVLVNNAGAYRTKRGVSGNGVELTFAVPDAIMWVVKRFLEKPEAGGARIARLAVADDVAGVTGAYVYKDEVRAFEIPAATQQKTEQLLQISRRLTGI